jgi:hypothetical protein
MVVSPSSTYLGELACAPLTPRANAVTEYRGEKIRESGSADRHFANCRNESRSWAVIVPAPRVVRFNSASLAEIG